MLAMRRLLPLLLLLSTLALAAVARAAPPSAEALFAPPGFGGAMLSPDGRKLALLLRAAGQRTRLAVLDLTTLKSEVVAAFDDQDVRRAFWVNDTRLIFDMRVEMVGLGRARNGSGLYAVNANGSGFRHLVQAEGQPFVRTPDAPELLHWATTLRHLPQAAGSPDGEPRVAVTSKAGRSALHLRQHDGRWQALAEFDMLDGSEVQPRWVAPDGRLYGTAAYRGRNAVFLLDPATLKLQGAPLAASDLFDLHPEFIGDEQKLLGLRHTIDAEVTQWLDPAAPRRLTLGAGAGNVRRSARGRLHLPPRHGQALAGGPQPAGAGPEDPGPD